MRRIVTRQALSAVLALIPVACRSDRLALPAFSARVVVHAVLDPSVGEQVILVERTRIDSAEVHGSLSARDLLTSAGATPISGAHVRLIGPAGDTVVAREDLVTRGDGTGAGMYRVRSVVRADTGEGGPAGALRLVPGARYRLEVETSLGLVRGATRIPDVPVAADRGARRFDLDRDTLHIPRRTMRGGAAAFVVRHAFPGFASSSRLVSVLDDRLIYPADSDDEAWTFAASRRWIWPGTTQSFAVAAVDSNYLRYSIAGADPFGDDVRGNTLHGGVGLFGAVGTLTDVVLELVATRDHPLEGDWQSLGSSAGLPVALRLYESPRFARRTGDTLVLTGTARVGTANPLVAQGRVVADSLFLTVAPSASAANTRRYVGALQRDTLTLQAVGSAVRMRYRHLP